MKKILFIPDCNLGSFVQKEVPEKDIKLLQGGCPVHAAVTLEDLMAAKAKHPNALVLVHPECVPAVAEKKLIMLVQLPALWSLLRNLTLRNS